MTSNPSGVFGIFQTDFKLSGKGIFTPELNSFKASYFPLYLEIYFLARVQGAIRLKFLPKRLFPADLFFSACFFFFSHIACPFCYTPSLNSSFSYM